MPGTGSIRLMWLSSSIPVPGVVTLEPNALCSVWVVLTIVPSASMTVQWVVLAALAAHEPRHLGKLARPRGPAPARGSDLGPPLVGVAARGQLGDRHVDAVGIGHVPAPVGERDLERFGQQVDVAWRAELQAVVTDREASSRLSICTMCVPPEDGGAVEMIS